MGKTPLVTAAGACGPAGIRCYTRSTTGYIREACLDIGVRGLQFANSQKDHEILSQSRDWFPGEYEHECYAESAACAIGWGAWGVRLFFQRQDYAIMQSYHNGSWRATDFEQPGCLPGTDIAEVHTDGGRQVILFFQDASGWLCYRHLKDSGWCHAMRLCPAAMKTGIAATTWTADLSEVRLYYQDEEFAIREYIGSDDDWYETSTIIYQHDRPLGSIAAVSWQGPSKEIHIRLYFQDLQGDIIELCYGSNMPEWQTGAFVQNALQGTSISASVRTLHKNAGCFINVMWSDTDSRIYHRSYADSVGWLDASVMAELRDKRIKFPGSRNRSSAWR